MNAEVQAFRRKWELIKLWQGLRAAKKRTLGKGKSRKEQLACLGWTLYLR